MSDMRDSPAVLEPPPLFTDAPPVVPDSVVPVVQTGLSPKVVADRIEANRWESQTEMRKRLRREQADQRNEQIAELLNDPKSDLVEVNRLIALEINSTIGQTNAWQDNEVLANMRPYIERVKMLRELGKTMTEREFLSHRDELNLNGPKFQFVLEFLLTNFAKALRDIGVEESQAQAVMLQVIDLQKAGDETMRRGLAKIDKGRE